MPRDPTGRWWPEVSFLAGTCKALGDLRGCSNTAGMPRDMQGSRPALAATEGEKLIEFYTPGEVATARPILHPLVPGHGHQHRVFAVLGRMTCKAKRWGSHLPASQARTHIPPHCLEEGAHPQWSLSAARAHGCLSLAGHRRS